MTLATHAMRIAQSRAAAMLVIGALAVAGCGGSAATATPPLVSAAPASAAPSSSGSGSGTGSGTCGEGTAALVMKQLANPDVVSVTTEGGCHDATIVTTLGAADVSKALAICDAAALIAYAGDLSSVTVTGTNNKELSIGIKGQQCIGEP